MNFEYIIEKFTKEDGSIRVLYTSAGVSDKRISMVIPSELLSDSDENVINDFIIKRSPISKWNVEKSITQTMENTMNNKIGINNIVSTEEYEDLMNKQTTKPIEVI